MKTHGVVNRTLTFGLYYSDTAHYNSTGKHTKSFPSDGIWANQGRFISSTISYGPEPWPGATASPTEHDHYLGHTHMHPNKMCTQTHTLEHFLNAVLVPNHWQSCNARRHRDRQRSSPWPKNSLLHLGNSQSHGISLSRGRPERSDGGIKGFDAWELRFVSRNNK